MDSLFILCGMISVMLVGLWFRKYFFMPKGEAPTATEDSATGLFILLLAALTLGWLPESKIPFEHSVSEFAKMLFGALGAMYLKSGYEKHDEQWQKKRRGAPESPPNKTTIFFRQETSTTQASRDEESKGQP